MAWRPADGVAKGQSVSLGQGKVTAVAPMVLPDAAPGKDERDIWDTFYPVVDGRFWLVPQNAADLLAVLRMTGADAPAGVCVDAPATTIVEPRALRDGSGLVVHAINYDASAEATPVAVHLAQAPCDLSAVRLAPGVADQPLAVEAAGDGCTVVADNDRPYSLVVIQGWAVRR